MAETSTRTDDGLPKVYPSPRPHGTTTYFAGAGDDTTNNIVGGGNKIIFSLTAGDSSKTVDLEFIEDIWIKDGYMICEDAPFGATIDIIVIHPVNGVVGCFAKNVPIFRSGWFTLDTEDRAKIDMGLILRIIVNNSSGTAPEEAKTAFKLVGRIEMYRVNTI